MNEEIANKVAYCQQILDQALDILPKQKDLELFDKALEAISMINQYQIIELSNLVQKIMEIKELKSLAVESLGFWLQVPCFKEQAYKMFLEDPDPEIKYTALLSWASYYVGTKNPIVLKKLYMILINDKYPVPIRSIALTGILKVSTFKYKHDYLSMANLMNITSKEIFFEQVNWQVIMKIMKIYAPKALKIYPIK